MIVQLNDDLSFPHPKYAEPDGLLAIGGDLSTERLLLAYEHGIFPWFSPNEPILWYATQPRFVVFPNEVRVSKSMKKWMRKTDYSITEDTAFVQVMYGCKLAKRVNQQGSWIGKEMILAYHELHKKGYAKSIEVWNEQKELVGGLYGVVLHNCFFGESMFHTESNTSKFAFIHLCKHFNYKVIDCQMYTAHLESLGGRMIPFDDFLKIIQLPK